MMCALSDWRGTVGRRVHWEMLPRDAGGGGTRVVHTGAWPPSDLQSAAGTAQCAGHWGWMHAEWHCCKSALHVCAIQPSRHC